MSEPARRIVALVDEGATSGSVYDLAAFVAVRTGAAVDLLHVLGRGEGGAQDLSGAIRLGARSSLMEELTARDEQQAKGAVAAGWVLLDAARAKLAAHGIDTPTARLRHGELAPTVAEAAQDVDIVLCGRPSDVTTVERIVRAVHKPVLVAPDSFRPIARVLVGYDASTPAQRAVDHVLHDPLFRGLAVHVVTVGEDTASARKDLDRVRVRLADTGIDAEISIVPGQPGHALARLIDEGRFDMLVIGAYGHSRLRRLFTGSTTTETLRACKVAALIVGGG